MKKAKFALWLSLMNAALFAPPAHASCYDPRKVIRAMATIARGTSPVVIAHRGIWRGEGDNVVNPENSAPSLTSADERCVEAVEMDVKSLDDGTPVIMHDFNMGGTTNIWEDIPHSKPYNPVTNLGSNPKVASTSAIRFDIVELLVKRGLQEVSDYQPPTVRDLYNYYYEHRLSTVIVLDIKNQDAAIAIAKILDEDKRDYAFGTQAVPLRARDLTVFKINATVWPNGVWYINDMMREGVANPPVVIPIWTTNMELALRKLWGVSPHESLESWLAGESGGTFLTPEINKKQRGEDKFLGSLMASARSAKYSISVFNAIPDWLGGGEFAGKSGIKSSEAFYKATGACCYDLKSIYFPSDGKAYEGRRDTGDLRGDWHFLYGSGSENFGAITTDLGLQMIKDIEDNYQRDVRRYGVASWWQESFYVCGRNMVVRYLQDLEKPSQFDEVWHWTPPARLQEPFRHIDECKPTTDGRLLLSSSIGGVGILDVDTHALTMFPSMPQAHTLTMIGRTLVAVAVANSNNGKDGDKIYLYQLVAGQPKRVSYEALKGAHGLVWDGVRQQLYALGSEEMAIYQVKVTSTRTWLEPVTRVLLPGQRGGHDLAVIDDDLLVATLAQDVQQFDRRSNSFSTFTPMAGFAKVKSVDVDQRNGRIAYQQAGKSWWAVEAKFLNPGGVVSTNGQQIYRVRWNDPRPEIHLDVGNSKP